MTKIDQQLTQLAKRSVVIAGHKTSISLESAFWDALKQAARRRKVTVNELVTQIDGARQGNLSSALRVFLLLEPDATPSLAYREQHQLVEQAAHSAP